jgi:hypothetical protein
MSEPAQVPVQEDELPHIDLSSIPPQASVEEAIDPVVVSALCDWKGEGIDKLSFAKGDHITISKKDGGSWAFGTIQDGSSGWFPLECADLQNTGITAYVKKVKPTNFSKLAS